MVVSSPPSVAAVTLTSSPASVPVEVSAPTPTISAATSFSISFIAIERPMATEVALPVPMATEIAAAPASEPMEEPSCAFTVAEETTIPSVALPVASAPEIRAETSVPMRLRAKTPAAETAAALPPSPTATAPAAARTEAEIVCSPVASTTRSASASPLSRIAVFSISACTTKPLRARSIRFHRSGLE